jgi:group I intron endonuclease
MIGSIYKITNLLNNKVYIGQTIQKLSDRWNRHCNMNCSEAEHNMIIKKAIIKYGKENFSIEIIETCDSKYLNEKEKYYINKFNTYKEGYNSTLGGQKGAKMIQTPEDICKEIIELYKYGFSLRDLAKEYFIDKATVKGILIKYNIIIRDTRTYKLSQLDRVNIIEDLNKGFSRKDIINKYQISKSYLSQLITGNRRI